jgi:hypothetical protein
VRPTLALGTKASLALPANDASTDGSQRRTARLPAPAGQRYALLVWEAPARLDMDAAATQTGSGRDSGGEVDRLLRECRVPIGLCEDAVEPFVEEVAERARTDRRATRRVPRGNYGEPADPLLAVALDCSSEQTSALQTSAHAKVAD